MNRKAFIICVVVVFALFVGGLIWWRAKDNPSPNQVVKVGAILPMTGSAANYGELMRRGIQMAVEEQGGGPAGSALKLDVVIEDSKSVPRDGVSAMQKLVQLDKVSAVMPALSGIVLACIPIAEQNQVVVLNNPANSPKLRGAGPLVFNLIILSDQDSEYLANYAYNKLGARNAGIFFVNNDSGRGYADSFNKKFTELGGKVVLSEAHEQGATEFRPIAEKFRAAKVDLVFMGSYYAESALFIKQAKELGLQAKWLSYSSVETPEFLKLAGAAAEGIIYSQPGFDVNSGDQLSQQFVTNYRKRYGQEPDLWSAQYYDGTRLLQAAVNSGARTGSQIQNYLKTLNQFHGVTGPITFDQQGCVTRQVQFKTVRSGRFEYIQE